MTSKGRPRIDGTAKRPQSVHLTAEHIAIAKRLGDGNVSAGVRAALEMGGKADWALNYIAHSMEGEHAAQLRYILGDENNCRPCMTCKNLVPVGVAYCDRCQAARGTE